MAAAALVYYLLLLLNLAIRLDVFDTREKTHQLRINSHKGGNKAESLGQLMGEATWFMGRWWND
jgi:hypothetical protein